MRAVPETALFRITQDALRVRGTRTGAICTTIGRNVSAYFVKMMLQFAPYRSNRGNVENNAASILRTERLTGASRLEKAFKG